MLPASIVVLELTSRHTSKALLIWAPQIIYLVAYDRLRYIKPDRRTIVLLARSNDPRIVIYLCVLRLGAFTFIVTMFADDATVMASRKGKI